MIQNNLSSGVQEALEYLSTGGLGEVIGFTSLAVEHRQPKVQSDTDMAMALCILASRALDAESTIARLTAALSAETEACAKICDAEAERRFANARAAEAGSMEWGADTESSSIAQDHKALTARALAAAIRQRQGERS